MFKFIHAADLHLDSPLRGLEQYEGAPVEEIRGATRRALENLVQLAIDEEAAFVLVAGDVYDGSWRDYRTGLFFAAEMARLRLAGIPVYLISGNHDAANRMTRALKLPDNVVRLPSEKPATERLDDYGVAIHGQGFANAAVPENLAQAYPAAVPGAFNIGLLHTSAAGSQLHETYAPCGYDDLRGKQYDYWALGHVHQRGSPWNDPRIQYSGNTQGRHSRECGAKGCLVVTVDERRQAGVRFEPLDVLRWERSRIDATGAVNGYDVVDRFGNSLETLLAGCEGRTLAVRVEIVGACRAHEALAAEPVRWTNELRTVARDVGAENVWLEKIKLETSAEPAAAEAPPTEGPLGELAELVGELRGKPELLAELVGELAELERKLPPQLREGDERVDLDALVRQELDHVEPLLLARLSAAGRAT